MVPTAVQPATNWQIRSQLCCSLADGHVSNQRQILNLYTVQRCLSTNGINTLAYNQPGFNWSALYKLNNCNEVLAFFYEVLFSYLGEWPTPVTAAGEEVFE
jgi:hypothetical protein